MFQVSGDNEEISALGRGVFGKVLCTAFGGKPAVSVDAIVTGALNTVSEFLTAGPFQFGGTKAVAELFSEAIGRPEGGERIGAEARGRIGVVEDEAGVTPHGDGGGAFDDRPEAVTFAEVGDDAVGHESLLLELPDPCARPGSNEPEAVTSRPCA